MAKATLCDAFASFGVRDGVSTVTAGVLVRGTRVTTAWHSSETAPDVRNMKINAVCTLEGALLRALDEVRALKREIVDGES